MSTKVRDSSGQVSNSVAEALLSTIVLCEVQRDPYYQIQHAASI